jgi:D-sedoheptulose 7-phosphate isomerase
MNALKSNEDLVFLKNYFEQFQRLLDNTGVLLEDMSLAKEKILQTHLSGKKLMVIGNGGSAAVASHFSVDMTKNAGVRCMNLNESSLITCFSNDYGYEHWIEKAVEFYGDAGDLLIAISCSGKSKNILNGVEAARKKNFPTIMTFSGFASDNPLRGLGDINFWVNSKSYNMVETIHQSWLLALVDLIIGRAEYSANPELESLSRK